MSKKRQASIEFARIVACFVVICIHTVTWYTNADGLIRNSLFIRCFLTDGVPIFWYIMGYFLFANPNATLGARLKRTSFILLLPAFAVMVFSQIWQDWIVADFGEVSFWSCLDFHSFSFHNLFGNILSWSSKMTFGGHFWYIFAYVQVILWTPLLQFICVNEPKANRCRCYLMGLSALFLINQDISKFAVITINGNTYPITVFSVITPTLLSVLMGFETYMQRERIMKYASKLRILGVIGFVLFNGIKCFLSEHFMRVDTGNTHFLNIDSCFAYLASYSLFLAVYSMRIRDNSVFERVVLNVSKKTLGIYLIHGVVFRKLGAIGLRDFVYSAYYNHPNNLFVEIFCTFTYAAVVFVICYVLVWLLVVVRKTGVSLFCKEKKRYVIPK